MQAQRQHDEVAEMHMEADENAMSITAIEDLQVPNVHLFLLCTLSLYTSAIILLLVAWVQFPALCLPVGARHCSK